jgi:hypothetical protein
MGVDEEISFIQASLKTLRFDYDLFFSGAAKFPPFKLRTELEKRVRALSNQNIDKLALRFKLQSVMTSYNSHIALWEKQMKLRESGIRDPRLASTVRSGLKEIAALDSGKKVAEQQAAASAAADEAALTADELAEMQQAAATAAVASVKTTQRAMTAVTPEMIQAAGKSAAGKSGSAFKIGNRAAPPAPAPYSRLFDEFSKLKRETGEKLGYDLEKFSAMMEKKKTELQAKGLKSVDFGVQIKDGKVILKAKSQAGERK